jgi:hypothetical protein
MPSHDYTLVEKAGRYLFIQKSAKISFSKYGEKFPIYKEIFTLLGKFLRLPATNRPPPKGG